MLLFDKKNLKTDPFPYVVACPAVEPEFYNKLKEEYPTISDFEKQKAISGTEGSRTGYGLDLYRGDDEMEALLGRSSSWNKFAEYLNSEEFMNLALNMFKEELPKQGCAVSSEQAVFSREFETRKGIESEKSKSGPVAWVKKIMGLERQDDNKRNILYSRFDLHCGIETYAKAVHCDHVNRLASLVFYFCDIEEDGIEGGELTIFKHRKTKAPQNYERHPSPSNVEKVATIAPKNNTAVLFLCCNNSYHGVNAITRIENPRNFAYINISSQAGRIW